MLIGTSLDARVVSAQPFIRETGKNRITKIRVVDNPGRKNDRNPARFYNAEGWGAVGDGLARLAKGDVVSLTGELKLDKYTDKTGAERTDDVLTVTNFRVQQSTAFFEGGPGSKVAEPHAVDDGPAPQDDDGIPF